jgi:protein O-GlcNAc transferase
MAESKLQDTFQTAQARHRAGDADGAERLYREILGRDPNHSDALHFLGMLSGDRGQTERAVELIQRSIALDPSRPHYHNNLGEALRKAGRFDEAAQAYRAAIALRSDYAIAYYNLGLTLALQAKTREAIECYRRAVAIKPDFTQAWVKLARASHGLGQFQEAIDSSRQALAHEPRSAEAYFQLGAALGATGAIEAAIDAHRTALKFKPEYAEAHYNLGLIQSQRDQFDQAIASFQRAIELSPSAPQPHDALGIVWQKKLGFEEAIACHGRAIEIKPDFAQALGNLGTAFKAQGRLDEAIEANRKAIELNPGDSAAWSNLLFMLHYHPGYDAQTVFREHLEFGSRFSRKIAASYCNDANPSRRLRIGYVSQDFRLHAVWFFFEPLLAHRERAAFEVFCYSNLANPDSITRRLRGLADQWRDVAFMSDDQLELQIRADRIDILIDLAGHTAGNRLPVFARKPAPVQVTLLGYPNTTGLGAVDYRITDAIADPPGFSDSIHTEKLLRLPRCAWCYRPPLEMLEPNDLPAPAAGKITFGSFNHLSKVSSTTIELWAAVLRRVGGSGLVIKSVNLADEGARRLYHERFVAAGMSPERFELLGPAGSYLEHLQRYHRVDIALDTLPYNGTTTTCEALWMGVPVVTLTGPAHVSRVGTSLLRNVGMGELAADSGDAYVDIAASLAFDLPRLKTLRSTLRGRLNSSPLMDGLHYASQVESALRSAWVSWCS